MIWSESLLSAWINAQADLSLLGFQAILLDWTWFELSADDTNRFKVKWYEHQAPHLRLIIV